MIEKCWEKETEVKIERKRAEGEREEEPLSVIQTEQTDSILEDSRLRAESSQGRQKAYSSLESSLDNAHAHTDTHTTQAWIKDAQALLPWYNPHSSTDPNTHLKSPPDTRPQSGNREKNHLSGLIQHKKSWEAEKSDSREAKHRDHGFSKLSAGLCPLIDLSI